MLRGAPSPFRRRARVLCVGAARSAQSSPTWRARRAPRRSRSPRARAPRRRRRRAPRSTARRPTRRPPRRARPLTARPAKRRRRRRARRRASTRRAAAPRARSGRRRRGRRGRRTACPTFGTTASGCRGGPASRTPGATPSRRVSALKLSFTPGAAVSGKLITTTRTAHAGYCRAAVGRGPGVLRRAGLRALGCRALQVAQLRRACCMAA